MKPRIRVAALAVAIGGLAGSHTAGAQSGATRAVRGVVYDSLAKAPLAHAMVSMVSRSDQTVPARTVATDSAGRFAFAGLAPGLYLIGFEAPILDSLGVAAPTRVVQLAADGHGTVIVNLAIPSAGTMHDAYCPNRPKGDSTSVFLGHLSNASNRGVIANGEIDATWVDVVRTNKKVSVEPQAAQARSGQDGWFALCDLPAGAMVAMHAVAGPDTSNVVYFQTPLERGLIRHELYLADRNAPRTGVIVGRVVDADRKRPVVGAQVHSDAAGATTTSADSGKFTLSNVPYGTSDIIVRSIGFLPQRAVVDVLAGEPTPVNLSLLTSGNVLDTVRVRAFQAIADDNGFSHRRKAGLGHYFDLAQIERMQPFETADILRRVAGVRVATRGFDSRIVTLNPMTGSFTCTPTFWLDGKKLQGIANTRDLEMVAPAEELAGVEVYKDAMEVPPEFDGGSGSGCGAIVMWSLPYQLWSGHRGR